jgi:hypothetical protein
MNYEKIADAFNVWIDRYMNHPEEFCWEFQEASLFNAERLAGKQPSYGASCANYLKSIIDAM